MWDFFILLAFLEGGDTVFVFAFRTDSFNELVMRCLWKVNELMLNDLLFVFSTKNMEKEFTVGLQHFNTFKILYIV